MAMSDAEKAIYAWPSDTPEQRQAQVDALAALVDDDNDPYDAHHGTDRSEESLNFVRETDPERFDRVMGKIVAGT